MFCTNPRCMTGAFGDKIEKPLEECPSCEEPLAYRAEELLDESPIQIVPETRRSQVQMSKLIEQAIFKEKHLAVEAGVGTGKTFAYLTPAIQQTGRVVVSTATKNLQDQIINKDIPYLRDKFTSLNQVSFSAQVYKGRSNYLCIDELQKTSFEDDEIDKQDIIADLKSKSLDVGPGNYGEFAEYDKNVQYAADDNVSAQGCTGDDCLYHKKCPYFQLQVQAPTVQVVNHAYLMSKFKRNVNTFKDVDVLIIDEAHRFGDFVRTAFSDTLDFTRLIKFFKESVRKKGRVDDSIRLEKLTTSKVEVNLGRPIIINDGETEKSTRGISFQKNTSNTEIATSRTIREAITAAENLHKYLKNKSNYGKEIRSTEFRRQVLDNKKDWIKSIFSLLTSIEGTKDGMSDKDYVRMFGRAKRYKEGLRKFFNDKNLYTHYTQTERMPKRHKKDWKTSLVTEPVISGPFVNLLVERSGINTIIFTSATMSDGNRMYNFERDMMLGSLDDDTYTSKMLGTNYDYKNCVQAYIESDSALKPVRSNKDEEYSTYIKTLTDRIDELAAITGGRTFVLFTNYRDMGNTYEHIQNRGYEVLCQNKFSDPDVVLEDYLEAVQQNKRPILLGTKSFWHGVSIEGDALKQVIIPKAPFPNPHSPHMEGKSDYLQQSTFSLSKPEMIREFKQGAGRLIRSNDDKGILSILDARISGNRWGTSVVGGLPMVVPEHNVTHNIEDLSDPYQDES